MHFTDAPTCNISKDSKLNECTIAHDKSYIYIIKIRPNTRPLGRSLILLASDSTSYTKVNACWWAQPIPQSFAYLENLVKNHIEDQYMRITAARWVGSHIFKTTIDNGKVPVDSATNCISFPLHICVIVPSIEQLIQKVFLQNCPKKSPMDFQCTICQ